MARMIDHGGSCCGVRHIHGMDNTTVAELERHIASLDAETNVAHGNDRAEAGRLIEVILSSRQVGDTARGGTNSGWAACVQREGGWPAVMQRLGFRLVSRFLNANSGKECFIFHRVPHFKALTNLPFAWNFEASPAVRDAGGPGVARAVPAVRPAGDTALRVNDRVEYIYNNNRDVPIGTLGTVIEPNSGGNPRIRWDNGHTGNNGRTWCRRIADAPAAPAPVRDILTRYMNVFADGREGGEYPTLEAARLAAPRCRRVVRVVYRSDGTNTRFEA